VADRGRAAAREQSRPPLRAVITDWGGVMTNPVLESVSAWMDAEQIDRESYLEVMRAWVPSAYGGALGDSPIHALERGECSEEEFERALAGRLLRLDGGAVEPAGLLRRMFAASTVVPAMRDLLGAVRKAGFRTAMLSNSWGRDDYPRELFPVLFDAVVISCEVGMRKPEERIFQHTVGLLGLRPAECAFVDDVEANVAAARAVGLVGVLHTDPEGTGAALAELLGIPLG
jgi:putative hydrolase of the HAD superfamily